MTRLRIGLNDLGNSRRGSIAMLAALAIGAIAVVIAASIDFNRQMSARMEFQQALDAAALAAGRHQIDNATISETALKTYAQGFFTAQLPAGTTVDSFNLVLDTTQNDIDLTAVGHIGATVGHVAGLPTLGFRAEASSLFATPEPLEISLVLDMSGSMSGSKLTNLKTAATSLVNNLMRNDGAVKLGIVPFNRYVNVGVGNRNASWMSVPADTSGTWNSCWASWQSHINAGCTRVPAVCNNDGVPSACEQWSCPSTPVNDVCSSGTWTNTWYGCVASRSYPRNIRDIDYNFERVPGVMGSWNFCPGALLPLTTVKADALAAVNALSASGETYIATGLTWGYRVLTSNAPFNEGTNETAFATQNGRKALVLMSDGQNTASPNGTANHNGSNRTVADQYTAEVCTEIKAAGFELYVIAYEVTDSATLSMLQTCASAGGYYDAGNATQLQQAFASITANLQKLRISR